MLEVNQNLDKRLMIYKHEEDASFVLRIIWQNRSAICFVLFSSYTL